MLFIFTYNFKFHLLIIKESKNLLHLVEIVMSHAGRSGVRRHDVIDSLENFK